MKRNLSRLFPKDTRIRDMQEKRAKIKELESKRDQLVDHGFTNMAKSIENQIRNLKREVDKLERV